MFKKVEGIIKAAIPVTIGVAIFALVVNFAVKNDIAWIKDLRDAFDS